jgi:hypothetical protein
MEVVTREMRTEYSRVVQNLKEETHVGIIIK